MTLPKFSFRLSDAVALTALLIAGLSYLESRSANELARQRASADQVLVLRASLESEQRITLSPVNEDHVIQATEYVFPNEVRRARVELNAEAVVMELPWIEHGIQNSMEYARRQGGISVVNGEMPVGVITAYNVDGITKVDCSIYKLAYQSSVPASGAVSTTLRGMAIAQRGINCDDIKTVVERRWDERAVD